MYYCLIVITIKCTVSVFIYKKIGYVTYTIYARFLKSCFAGCSECTSIGFLKDMCEKKESFKNNTATDGYRNGTHALENGG